MYERKDTTYYNEEGCASSIRPQCGLNTEGTASVTLYYTVSTTGAADYGG